MKIKRFFAKEMREGIKQVGKDLGADAVILSNKQVNGGVEIIAAVDYDESLLRIEALADQASAPAAKATDELFVYPKQGQSEEKQAEDRYQCHSWSVGQTGFDPTRAGGNVEGPFANGKGTYILSAQKSFLDLIISSRPKSKKCRIHPKKK